MLSLSSLNTDIYSECFQLQKEKFRLGLTEFLWNIYLFLHGQCLLL